MPLTGDRIGDIHETLTAQKKVPVAANTRIFLGALVSYDANGLCVPAVDSAVQSGKAVHFAVEAADNSAGADGDKHVMVMTRGAALVVAGALTEADRGKVVHATADDTLALTSTNDRPVGPILDVDGRFATVQIG